MGSDMTLTATPAGTLDALRAILGDDGILVGADVAARTTTDWSGERAVAPDAVLLPRTPEQVAQVLAICQRTGQAVAIQGGLTGLAGGANPKTTELALSLSRLSSIEDLDEAGGTVIVQAGVTLQQLQDFLTPKGWYLPLDLGARASCQLGGNASTNAGGSRVVRYGMMRESVLGLEVALADGTLLSMLNRVIKNNAGLDLKHLFIGAEGTLGVITRLSLKLVPQPTASATCLCALTSFEAATVLLREARRSLPGLSSFELLWDGYFSAALQTIAAQRPFQEHHPLYALIETLGSDESGLQSTLQIFLEQQMETGTLVDAVVPDSLSQARRLWDIREAAGEMMSRMRPFIAFDVSAPLGKMGGFVDLMKQQLHEKYPRTEHHFFGHLGDGNLHLLTGPYADKTDLHAVKSLVYQEVQNIGGSISGETGIGEAKKEFLPFSRSDAEISLMRVLKQTLDPKAILNRGRIFV